MLSLLKRNLVPLVFFAFIGVGVFSFLDYQEGEQSRARQLILTRRQGTAQIQQEIRQLANLSLVAEPVLEDYEEILAAFTALDGEISSAKSGLLEFSANPEYAEYLEAAQEYFDAYREEAREEQALFVQKYEILPLQTNFLNNFSLESLEQANNHLQVSQYLVDTLEEPRREGVYPVRVRDFLQEAVADEELSEDEVEAYRSLRVEEELFISAGFRLIRFTSIDNEVVLKAFESLEGVENSLRARYNLRRLSL